MYINLIGEMAKNGVKKKEIAKSLNITEKTIAAKISGKSPLYLKEAILIRNKFFPNCEMSYLFNEV